MENMSSLNNNSKDLEEMERIPHWEKLDSFNHDFFPKHEFLIRVYKFDSDKSTNQFVAEILDMAEKENHHPLLIAEWHKVTLSWSTHEKKSITSIDIRSARISDEIYQKINLLEGKDVA
jgi:4a-hydroxytetrahydrobiopterin dehydratase